MEVLVWRIAGFPKRFTGLSSAGKFPSISLFRTRACGAAVVCSSADGKHQQTQTLHILITEK